METLVDAEKFWRGKRVFVTGHTGFKGGWLCLLLKRLGAEVYGYSLEAPSKPSFYEAAGIGKLVSGETSDVADLDRLDSAFRRFSPQIVLHMAAQSLVRYAYLHPVDTYRTNVMGTVNVLEAVRRSQGVRAVIVVTSDKCYENKEWVWGYRENEAMGGYDPYSNSKGCAELVTSAYTRSYFHPDEYRHHGVAVASVRAGNVIGGGDWAADRLIPDIIRAVSDGRPVRIRHPHAVRPWQHVLEPVSAYLTLAQRLYVEGPTFGGGWNFGPDENDARPVQWIVERLMASWGDGAAWELEQGPQPHEAHYLKLDCSKARTSLDWRPRWSLTQALDRIVEWYKAYQDQRDVLQISLAQLDDFMATVSYREYDCEG